MNPMVYCGLYPIDTSRYNDLREALEKLQLNDAALQFEPKTSQALRALVSVAVSRSLAYGCCSERLEHLSSNLELITTAPSVIYHVNKTDGTTVTVDNPAISLNQVLLKMSKNLLSKHKSWYQMTM